MGAHWAHTEFADPVTREVVTLFSPRTQDWNEHFASSTGEPTILEGKTPCGRATIELLQLNHPTMVAVRRLLIALGLFPD
jgi:hypothetical protein